MMLARRIFKVGSGSALAQLLTALSTPILTRLYAPEAHAIWAVFLSVSLLFSGIATLRYELAVVLPKQRETAASLVFAGLFSALAFSLMGAIAVYLSHDILFETGQVPFVRAWIWLVPLAVFSAATHQLMAAWCTREASFGAYSFGQFLLPSAVVGSQLLFALSGRTDASGLVGGTVAGQLLAAGLMAAYIGKRDLHGLRGACRLRCIMSAMLQYKSYPLYMTPSTLAGVARERSSYFLLGRFGAPEAAGHYGLVSRIIGLPNTFVAGAIRPVFFQHAVGKDIRALQEPVIESIRLLGCASALFWGPCVMHAPWLIQKLFGSAWGPAAPLAIALSVPAIPLLMGNWADRMFDVLGRQRLAFGLELAFAFISILALLVGYWVWGDVLLAVIVQCAALTAYYMTWLVVFFRVAGYPTRHLLWIFFEVALAGAVSLAVCYVLTVFLPGVGALLTGASLAAFGALLLGSRGWVKVRNCLGIVNEPPDKSVD